MIYRILNLVNQFSLVSSLIRVNKLFFIHEKSNINLRLQNNLIFRHASATPLTILSCSLENLAASIPEKQRKQNISVAKEALEHLTELISAVTKSDEKNQHFLVGHALDEVVFLFKSKQGCTIHYSNFLPKDLKIHGNKLYFQEIVICLLNNAYEAYQDKKIAHISLSASVVNNKIFFGVVDFAIGMTQLGQKLAFMKGVSYKENGLGLGLSFVKQTIENEFKGVLKMISGYGVGTHVQVVIPILDPYTQSLLQS